MDKQEYTLTVFIGDINIQTAKLAQQSDEFAFLIDFNNCEDFLQSPLQTNTTVYTSLGDLPNDLNACWSLLTSADTVVYCPTQDWSDKKVLDPTDPTKCMQGLTEEMLLCLPEHITVKNFNRNNLVPDPMPLVDFRKTDGQQLWIAGCSISHGVGVTDYTRYGQLVANELNLPCSFLTRDGSAIDWAADQIIRSDIRPGDIVIWGLTTSYRVTYINEHKLERGVTIQSYQQNTNLDSIVPKKVLFSQNTAYNHIYSVERVINFCKVAQAKLLIVGLLTSPTSHRHLANKSEFFQYPYNISVENNLLHINNYKDIGSDNKHPGVQQHQSYKNFIISLLNK